jgi:ribosomal protein S18 acetylase RimI-like enzyme
MITIRPARPDDYSVFRRLSPELHVDDPMPSAERWSSDIAPTMLIAERERRSVGYGFFQVLHGIGYVRNVVSAPEARRTGVGRALMSAMAAHFRSHGAMAWCLNVKPTNLAAVHLYESLGMKLQYASAALRMSWDRLDDLPADPPNAVVTFISPTDDAELESALGLPSGLLTDYRDKRRTLLQVRHAATREPLGAAAFDPAFPGAFPFRAQKPEHGALLLRAMRAHALSEHDWVQLVIENQPQLIDVLKAAGATLYLEFVHYRGQL